MNNSLNTAIIAGAFALAAVPCQGHSLLHDLERLHAAVWSDVGAQMQGSCVRFNVQEFDDRYELEATVPGYGKEEITLNVEDARGRAKITISGKKEQKESAQEEGRFLTRQYTTAEFSVERILRAEIKTESVKAELKDGILKVVLPKKAPQEVIKSSIAIEVK